MASPAAFPLLVSTVLGSRIGGFDGFQKCGVMISDRVIGLFLKLLSDSWVTLGTYARKRNKATCAVMRDELWACKTWDRCVDLTCSLVSFSATSERQGCMQPTPVSERSLASSPQALRRRRATFMRRTRLFSRLFLVCRGGRFDRK